MLPGIRTIIASDSRLYSEGLRQLLPPPRYEVVAIASAAVEAVREARAIRPNVMVIDSDMPDALSAAFHATEGAPSVYLLALSVPENDDSVISWAEAGVFSFVSRNSSTERFRAAIEVTARGDSSCPPNLTRRLVARVRESARRSGTSITPYASLTPREREIADLLRSGHSNKDIGRDLGIEVATVKSHVHSVLAKLQLRRRSEVAGAVTSTTRRTA